jgi:hypothetical protein
MHLDELTCRREKFGLVRNDEERVGPLWSSNAVDKAECDRTPVAIKLSGPSGSLPCSGT